MYSMFARVRKYAPVCVHACCVCARVRASVCVCIYVCVCVLVCTCRGIPKCGVRYHLHGKNI